MHDDCKAMCNEFVAKYCREDDSSATASSVGSFFDGTLAAVLRGLNAAGLAVGDFWTWVPVILQLIAAIGPKIEQIIQLIRDAIQQGLHPKDLMALHEG
ncbi:MAG TPA: hypothetical protein VGJ05_15905 [Fimbriiglobus sp.]|jgi:hypothetical protein